MSRNRIDHLHQELQFSEKRPQRPENGIKDGFEEMGHEISVWNIPSGITGLPFQMFVAPRHFSLERPKKWCFIYFTTGFSENIL